MGEEQALMAVYRDLGAAFREHFGGWRAAVFSANQALCFELGLRADRQYKFFNGPIETRLLLFDIYTDGQRPQSKRAGTDETNSAGQKAPQRQCRRVRVRTRAVRGCRNAG